MELFPGYTAVEKIAEGSNAIIYRGRHDDLGTVILKLFRQHYPTPASVARFKKEFELIHGIDSPGVVRTHGLLEDRGRVALVLEDFDGRSLREELQRRGESTYPIEEFLAIAITLADTLAAIHACNIIHRDIKPQNVLYNRSLGAVKITDFGISMILAGESENIFDPSIIIGTLPYMSPEQTGRMNRTVDHRSDLYSLGITFYEMLTGSVPFMSSDPIEIIYCHIARLPQSPREAVPRIPIAISDIVMKLLAKNMEDRYRGASGLKTDLIECRDQLARRGFIPSFIPGLKDYDRRIVIPQAVIGRERELAGLLDAFNRACQGGSEVVVITGVPGVGKSVLVREMEKPVTERRGYFVHAGFERFRQAVPYSAIIHAFQKLMVRILAEGNERIDRWCDRIMAELGSNARVILDVLPELAHIVGDLPPVPALEAEQARNRFDQAVVDFIGVFARTDHPLVVFLDDLQWADLASLQLLQVLFGRYVPRYLLLVVSYRDGEVAIGDPLLAMLAEIRDHTSTVRLSPFSPESVVQYIHAALGDIVSEADHLARIIHAKTHGNPFFVHQVLKRLGDEGVLAFRSGEGWTWNRAVLQDIQVSDNVVEFLVERISILPVRTRDILTVAACIGNRFDLESLAALLEGDLSGLLAGIQAAVDEGLLYPEGDNFHFLHDRIHEAAYSLMAPSDRMVMHYRIGRAVLDAAGGGELTDKIFYVVNQINSGAALIADDREKTQFARLNLMAGLKAKAASAHTTAREYFTRGLDYLNDGAWESEYALMLSLHAERGECEYLSGNLETADAVFTRAIERARSDMDRARIYDRTIVLETSRGRHAEALRMGLRALRMFGISLSSRPRRIVIARLLLRVMLRLRGLDDRTIAAGHETDDPATIIILSLLMNTGTAAYFVNTNLVGALSLCMMNITLRSGMTPYASFAFTSYAMIIGNGLGDYRGARRFGELALVLNERFGNAPLKAKLLFLFGFLIGHWQIPDTRCMEYMRQALVAGLENGDNNYAVYAVINLLQFRVRHGDPLDQILEECAIHEDFVMRTRNDEFIKEFQLIRAFIHALQGDTTSVSSFSSPFFDEEGFIDSIGQYPITVHSYRIFRMEALFHDRRYGEALAIAEQIAPVIADIHYSQKNVVITAFYHALLCITALRNDPVASRRILRSRIRRYRKKLKNWAQHAPVNYAHYSLLIEAGWAELAGLPARASDHYEQAIEAANAGGYVNVAALANELAGEFYLRRGREFIARSYLFEAQYCYGRSGILAKVKILLDRYPQYCAGHHVRHAGGDSLAGTATATSGTRSIDVETLVKTSQVFAREIHMGRLLEKLILLIGESAGATRGAIVLERDARLVIEAQGNIVDGTVAVLQGIPVDQSPDISPAVVHYAARTRESLVLHDASVTGPFATDPYIRKNRIKSIICMPVINQGRLSAVFYAENNLTAHAFTAQRVEVLNILAAYMAIAIDNARLYALMEEKVRERTIALEHAYEEVNNAYGIIMEDITLARTIQENILPRDLYRIRDFDFNVRFLPMSNVGGDLYDIAELHPGLVRIFLADATGHGIQAALVTMLIKGEYEKIKGRDIPPPQLLAELNNAFYSGYRELSVFFTCVIVDLDAGQGTFRYASGGHPDQYALVDGELVTLGRTGKIIGIAPDVDYGMREMAFGGGDRLLLFSDGIFEEFDDNQREYGEERLLDLVNHHRADAPGRLIDVIIADVRAFTGKEQINASDDVTIVGVERILRG